MTRAERNRCIVGAAILVGAVVAVAVIHAIVTSSAGVQTRVAYELYLDDPEMMTLGGIGNGAFWDVWSSRLTDVSPARTQALVRRKARLLRQLRTCEPPADGTIERLSHDIVLSYLEGEVRAAPFALHNYLVDSYEGEQKSLLRLLTEHHPLTSEAGAEAYVSRLRHFPDKIDSVLQGLEARARLGVIAPAWSLEKVKAELGSLLAVSPTESILYTVLASKTAVIPHLAVDKRQELLADAAEAIATGVNPSLARLLEKVDTLAQHTPPGDGVWRLPDGAAYYAELLRQHTSTEMSAEEIHDIGLKEVARLEGELDAAMRALGLSVGSPADRLRTLASDPKRRFAAGRRGRTELLDTYRRGVDEARIAMAAVFERLPAGVVDVRPIQEHEGATAEAARGVIRRDGMVLFVNSVQPDTVPVFSVRSLVFHETIPGHYVQRGIQRSLPGVPMIRRVLPFTAFAEGWAMYAERLSYDLGLFPDPYDNIGRLQAELWRAARLVVDTGIHHYRWSRQRGIDYLAATTGLPDSQVQAEVERYVLNPGQACAYMIGMLRFLAMRDTARQALGERFRYPEYHKALLENGPMPLPMIELRIRRWQEERTGALAPRHDG